MTLFRHRIMGPGSAGDIWVSTLHTQGPVTLATAHGAWQSFVLGAISANLAGMWPTTTSATQLVTDELDPLTWKNVAQQTSAVTIPGSSPANAPSPRACMVVGLRTALPTRAGRGRMYMPSPSAAHYQNTGKFVEADCATIANDFASSLLSMKAIVTPVIAHRKTKTWDTIINVTVGDIAGTQRRRTNKDVQTYSEAGA